ncbi:MAG: hypothetical protein QW478_04710 [Candidatus Micrarchaeaceae archaeon]
MKTKRKVDRVLIKVNRVLIAMAFATAICYLIASLLYIIGILPIK